MGTQYVGILHVGFRYKHMKNIYIYICVLCIVQCTRRRMQRGEIYRKNVRVCVQIEHFGGGGWIH